MTRPSEITAAEHQRMVLRETLRLAVPLHMFELRDRPARILAAIASHAATTIGSHGDALQYGGKHCAQAFNALARGLAAAALTVEGGVDFQGLHWCRLPNCRAKHRFEHVPAVDLDTLGAPVDDDGPYRLLRHGQRRPIEDGPAVDDYQPDAQSA